MTPHMETGNALLERLAAVRNFRRLLGPTSDAADHLADGLVLFTTPDHHRGFMRVGVVPLDAVLAWNRAVARGPTRPGQTTEECMREHAASLLPPF